MDEEVTGEDLIRGLQQMLATRQEIFALMRALKESIDRDPEGWRRFCEAAEAEASASTPPEPSPALPPEEPRLRLVWSRD